MCLFSIGSYSPSCRVQNLCEDELATGYACDPTSKSDTPIVAQPGLLVRLTRNLDKQRGFVNGAVAVIRDVALYIYSLNRGVGRQISCLEIK